MATRAKWVGWLGSASALVLVAAAVAAVGAPPAGAATTTTTPVGSAPTLPAHAVVQGSVAPATPLRLTVAFKSRDPQGLEAAALAVSEVGSPTYRQFFTPAQFAQQYGPTAATLTAVENDLASLGVHPGAVSANGLALSVTATAAEAQSAFGIELHNVRLANGQVVYANNAAPRVPATVASAVSGILGLDNLTAARPLWQRAAPATPSSTASHTTTTQSRTSTAAEPQSVAVAGPQPCGAASTAGSQQGGYTANQIAKAYSFGGLYANSTLGTGITVAIYELSTYNAADISSFQACYGTSASVTNENIDGGPTDANGDVEDELDIEGVIGMAPKAAIKVYLGPNDESGALDIYTQIVSDDTASVVSTSWGNCEASEGSTDASAENTTFEEAALQGQTIVAASGDNGSEDCQPSNQSTALSVDDPSSQPFVTGVGGTSLTALGPAPTETVWNDGLGAGGGGISSLWQMPPVQHGNGVINTYSTRTTCGAPVGSSCRESPDVSASADPDSGYMVYYTGSATGFSGWQSIAGTSAAAPLWASLTALADQNCGCALGFLNTALYNIAAAGSGSFNDITVGNNDYLGDHKGAYPATTGYDMASGLGSPIAATLAAQLNPNSQAPTFTADSPPTTDTVNSPYSYTFTASGHPAPTFALNSGTLPTGLTLNSASGVLSGTPTATGASTFTVSAGNGVGTAAVSPSITVTITAASTLPGYTALVPERICDTRAAGSGVVANQCDSGGHSPLSTSGVMTVTVAGAAGVPANATAVVLHVTATGTNAASYLTVWPTGAAQPTAANLNWTKGQTVPNLVQTGVGTSGQVSVFNYAGSVDVIVDLEGYFAPSSGTLFFPVSPVRVCDTRLGEPGNQCNGNGTAAGTLGAGATKAVNVETGFGVPVGTTAVVLNVTATTTSAASYLTIWQTGATQPLASSLNWVAGQTISNRVMTAVGSGGDIDVFNAHGTTDVVIDLSGYFSGSGSGAGYFPITPVRICDTRMIGPGVASNPCDSSGPGTLAAGGSFALTGFSASTAAVVVNTTVTNTAAAGYLTVFPDDATTLPLAADLTWAAHQTIGNLVVADLGSTGALAVYNGSGASTDVILDEEGYYSTTAPAPGPAVPTLKKTG